MLLFKDYYFLYEDVTTEQITPYTTHLEGMKIEGSIIRNAGSSARTKIKNESQNLSDISRDNFIGFIIYEPTQNVYFFNRDLITHARAGVLLGIGIDPIKEYVNNSLCGYFNLGSTKKRIKFSYFSSNPKWLDTIDIKDVTEKAFKKALIILNPEEIAYLES